MALVATTVYGVLATLSGFLVPLTIAAVIGILASPIVDLLQRYRVPRPLGAVLVMLALSGVIVGSLAISIRGVIDQSDEIRQQLTAGIDALNTWLADIDIDLGVAGERVDQAGAAGIDWIGGLASYATTIFSGVMAFLVGTFLSLFFIYYVLADWHRLRNWVGANLGVPEDLGAAIVDDVTALVRRGFYALSASSLVTAVLIGGTMVILDLPLAFTVALVTFVTSYIPYLGAIFSGTFGFLVALGAGGTTEAIILLVVILVVQNVVQTVVGNRLTSSSLSLHPIAALISTIVGAALAGLIGAMLSAPVLAAIIAIHKRVSEYQPPAAAAAPIPLVDDAR
jgi:predicted PurR-regulated permease PerM